MEQKRHSSHQLSSSDLPPPSSRSPRQHCITICFYSPCNENVFREARIFSGIEQNLSEETKLCWKMSNLQCTNLQMLNVPTNLLSLAFGWLLENVCSAKDLIWTVAYSFQLIIPLYYSDKQLYQMAYTWEASFTELWRNCSGTSVC